MPSPRAWAGIVTQLQTPGSFYKSSICFTSTVEPHARCPIGSVALLAELAEQLPSQVARVPRTFTIDEGLVQATLDLGLEGVVAKRLDQPYRPGRRDGTWIKSKHRRSERMAIIGWRSRPTGQEFLAADLDGRARGWCAFGLPGEVRRRIADDAQRDGRQHRGAWVTPAPLLIVDVAHHGRPGGRLRDPILSAVEAGEKAEPLPNRATPTSRPRRPRRRNHHPGYESPLTPAGSGRPQNAAAICCGVTVE